MSDRIMLMKPPKTIWVFRTTVYTRLDIHKVKPVLGRLLQPEDQWNFDLEDCDHILRVETQSISPKAIIQALKNAGYHCEELEDIIFMPVAAKYSFETDQTQAEKAICGS